jgi:hypothetical protein
MNPLILEVIIKEKRQDMLQEAERQQLLAIYDANNPDWRARMQLGLGNFLIRLGEKLKSRYPQPLDPQDDLCHE